MQDHPRDSLGVLWTPKQVADYLGVDRGTIYKWLWKKSVFDPAKIVRYTNQVRIPRSEVERVVNGIKNKSIKQ